MMTREYTCRILDLIDQGCLNTDELSTQLLQWMSESDVKEFYYANGYGDFEQEDEAA